MSSGVPEQMKVPGNAAKNGEEKNIPWSQQVDEASYENFATPTDDNAASNPNSMQFQYPPFNAKENQNFNWDANKTRKSSGNFEKKYSKPTFYNNSKRDDLQPNVWGTNNTRKIASDSVAGTLSKSNRPDDSHPSVNLDNRPNNVDDKKSQPVVAAPKKTTWASIASQPAKLTSRTALITSSHKKKGPGMPPPPMVPGKHLDVNTWDLPNNNPPLVPTPPPPIDIVQAEINFDAAANFGSEQQNLESKSDKTHKTRDSSRDEQKSNHSNANFGRARHSPNGHSRKYWSTQHPLYQNRQPQTMRRGEASISSDQSRYSERRNNYANYRQEQNNISQEFKDENTTQYSNNSSSVVELTSESPQAILDELQNKNNYNPTQIDLEKASNARFFVIKSYSEDDIHRSIKYEIWCSTDHGNKRLDDAFKERYHEGGHVLLFFSVNASGHFCGMAQMMTAVDYNSISSVWSQDKWKGNFKVKWIYVKDVPNLRLKHIRLENNENKSVTNSRDTQEVPNPQGIEVLQIMHSFKHSTSIFDDFSHYEKKQEEEVSSKKPLVPDNSMMQQMQSPINRQYNRQSDYRDRDNRTSGQQRFFGGGNYRDRNLSHKGGYHNNYNDNRRFESHRTGPSGVEFNSKEKDDADGILPNKGSEFNSRHSHKFDYNRRDDRIMSRTNNRDRESLEEYNKGEARYRSGPRESYNKDNEHVVVDRLRETDY